MANAGNAGACVARMPDEYSEERVALARPNSSSAGANATRAARAPSDEPSQSTRSQSPSRTLGGRDDV